MNTENIPPDENGGGMEPAFRVVESDNRILLLPLFDVAMLSTADRRRYERLHEASEPSYNEAYDSIAYRPVIIEPVLRGVVRDTHDITLSQVEYLLRNPTISGEMLELRWQAGQVWEAVVIAISPPIHRTVHWLKNRLR